MRQQVIIYQMRVTVALFVVECLLGIRTHLGFVDGNFKVVALGNF